MAASSFPRRMLAASQIALLLLTGGCWSNKEIETQSLEIAVAVDVPEPAASERELQRKSPGVDRTDRITSTYQLILPSLIGDIGGSTSDETSSSPFKNMTQTGDSLLENVRQLSLRTNAAPLGHHLKVIVIGDRLARKHDLMTFLDFFFRDNDIRLSPLVLICKGKASDTLEPLYKGDIPGFQIPETVRNQYRNNKILEPIRMYNLMSRLHAKTSFLLQNVVKTKEELVYSGAAVIQGTSGKLIGFLTEKDMESVFWIKGGGRKGGLLKLDDPELGAPLDMEINSVRSRIVPSMADGRFAFRIELEAEGDLMESWSHKDAGRGGVSEAFYAEVEKKLERKLKGNADLLIQKLQKTYGADAIGLYESVRVRMPKTWSRIHADWDRHFAEADITVSVSIALKGHGATELT
ncbi:Ger(x)C family spore germination protein [Paenibacillus sp. FSL W8-1187]|uniref:Ger(x)C family spore germination protein n=1 Tax=Paenibacillus sp. FSL W8-1187 TaxID=2975339 RepID=UPI0030DA0CCB